MSPRSTAGLDPVFIEAVFEPLPEYDDVEDGA